MKKRLYALLGAAGALGILLLLLPRSLTFEPPVDSAPAPPTKAAPGPLRSPAVEPPTIPAFPWPPPGASAEYQVRNKWVSDGAATKLSDVANRIETALQVANYEVWRYSSVPRGFALLTQIEQILIDGTPRPAPERFRADLPSYANATFLEFLQALAKAPPGQYRLIVFIVTDEPFAQTQQQPSEQEARLWIEQGMNRLPKIIGVLPYGDDYRTTALIYEYQKTSPSEPMRFVAKSRISGRDHLGKANILDGLTR